MKERNRKIEVVFIFFFLTCGYSCDPKVFALQFSFFICDIFSFFYLVKVHEECEGVLFDSLSLVLLFGLGQADPSCVKILVE